MVSFPMASDRARRTLEYIPVPVHSNTPRPLARVVLALRAATTPCLDAGGGRGRAERTTFFTASNASTEAGLEAAVEASSGTF